MAFVKYHLPALLYAGLIFLVSSIPQIPTELPSFTLGDKLVHSLEFGVFGWLLWRSASRWRLSARQITYLIVILLVGAVYAASDEIHQLFVTGRDSNIYDWIADVIGLALGLTVSYIVSQRRGVPRTMCEANQSGVID